MHRCFCGCQACWLSECWKRGCSLRMQHEDVVIMLVLPLLSTFLSEESLYCMVNSIKHAMHTNLDLSIMTNDQWPSNVNNDRLSPKRIAGLTMAIRCMMAAGQQRRQSKRRTIRRQSRQQYHWEIWYPQWDEMIIFYHPICCTPTSWCRRAARRWRLFNYSTWLSVLLLERLKLFVGFSGFLLA